MKSEWEMWWDEVISYRERGREREQWAAIMRASGLEGRASVDPRAHPRPVGHFRHATPDDARGTAFETLVILSGRDEFSHTWLKGDLPNSAARGSNSVDLRNGRRLDVPAVLLMNADGFNVWLPSLSVWRLSTIHVRIALIFHVGIWKS